MVKITIKPAKFGSKKVYRDGVAVAEFWFCRGRDWQGLYHRGELKDYETGRTINIGCYAWAADVDKYVRYAYANNDLDSL